MCLNNSHNRNFSALTLTPSRVLHTDCCDLSVGVEPTGAQNRVQANNVDFVTYLTCFNTSH